MLCGSCSTDVYQFEAYATLCIVMNKGAPTGDSVVVSLEEGKTLEDNKCILVTGLEVRSDMESDRVIFHLDMKGPVELESDSDVLVVDFDFKLHGKYWWSGVLDHLNSEEKADVVKRGLLGINRQAGEGVVLIVPPVVVALVSD